MKLKRRIVLAACLAMLAACLAGCSSRIGIADISGTEKIFLWGELYRLSPEGQYITDPEIVSDICNIVKELRSGRKLSGYSVGWSYALRFVDSEGNEIDSFFMRGSSVIVHNGIEYKVGSAGQELYEYIEETLDTPEMAMRIWGRPKYNYPGI